MVISAGTTMRNSRDRFKIVAIRLPPAMDGAETPLHNHTGRGTNNSHGIIISCAVIIIPAVVMAAAF